jgi:hypothetical protein
LERAYQEEGLIRTPTELSEAYQDTHSRLIRAPTELSGAYQDTHSKRAYQEAYQDTHSRLIRAPTIYGLSGHPLKKGLSGHH